MLLNAFSFMPLNSFMLRLSPYCSCYISASYFVNIVVERISVSYFVGYRHRDVVSIYQCHISLVIVAAMSYSYSVIVVAMFA